MLTRIEKTQQLIAKSGWDYLIIDAPIDLYYLAGVELSLGRLLIGQKQATLFVDGRYFESCQKAVHFPVKLTKGYGKESAFYQEVDLKNKKVAFDGATTTYLAAKDLEQLLGPTTQLLPIRHPLAPLREIKEKKEIDLLKKSATLASEGLQWVLGILKEGISEEEVAMKLEIFWKENGGDKLAFDPIIAFQENASQPHYRAGKRRLKRGDIIQFDIGVFKTRYASDLSRVFAFGKSDPLWEKIYSIVYRAQKKALDTLRPGIPIQEVDKAARDLIKTEGYGQYFPHSLGHGLGLELHEQPLIKSDPPFGERVLEEGMCITIEPGIYLPSQGGIRLEDAILITSSGYEPLFPLPLSETLPVI